MNDYSLLAQHITAILRADEPDQRTIETLPDDEITQIILNFAEKEG